MAKIVGSGTFTITATGKTNTINVTYSITAKDLYKYLKKQTRDRPCRPPKHIPPWDAECPNCDMLWQHHNLEDFMSRPEPKIYPLDYPIETNTSFTLINRS